MAELDEQPSRLTRHDIGNLSESDDPARPNPWLEMAGIFADDPELGPMTEEIYRERERSRAALDEASDDAR